MLSSVHIENIALIKSLNLNFSAGFTAFTGETGAGKSIVMDSIGMACGAKINKDIIRSGENEARVELLFCDLKDDTVKKCAEAGVFPDEDGCVFITRTIDSSGKSVSSVNGKRVPISVLREISSYMINIHGQHDNTELLRPESHISILDAFAGDEILKKSYIEKYSAFCSIKNRISELSVDDMEKKRMTDILKFQIEEIKSANLKDGEEEKLLSEKKRLLHSEKINKNAALCYHLLYDSINGSSATDNIDRAISSINELSGIIPDADSIAERLETVKYEIIDIAETANDFRDEVSQNPTQALNMIESRLDKIKRLCSRYGENIGAVNKFCQECEKKLSEIELSETKITELKKELKSIELDLKASAVSLSDARKKAAEKLSAAIEQELAYLDMKAVKFKTEFTQCDYGSDGIDKAEFVIKMNSGEGFHSLSKTASGGELSRLMLALKSALSEKEGAETLIFDEIDTGISGSTSRRIGIKLKRLAKKKQVICVTHSAQVASLSDSHFKVLKHIENGRTITSVLELQYDEKVREIARIISGMDISSASIDSAKELIEGRDSE